jgi:hypothetical protein
VEVWVIPVDESVVMAQDAFELLRQKPDGSRGEA